MQAGFWVARISLIKRTFLGVDCSCLEAQRDLSERKFLQGRDDLEFWVARMNLEAAVELPIRRNDVNLKLVTNDEQIGILPSSSRRRIHGFE